MELKNYQREVLRNIAQYNQCLSTTSTPAEAFRKYWEDKHVELLPDDEYLHEYVDTIADVPRVTLKVPTAGGKTFIAYNALQAIFNTLPKPGPQVVVWFVPYDTILTQTLNNLGNTLHPYRQTIDRLFGSNVTVYDKDTLLKGGKGFRQPSKVMNELSIFVLSIQSFATKKGDDLRAWRENGYLEEFTKLPIGRRVEGADETSLMQTIARLNPVVIIDESHNFTADLRVETLQMINPRYILELTATPRRTSNIISYVDAIQLKRENMVKLPVMVYNHPTVRDVLVAAITMQRSLERMARDEAANGGKYIRPIVLFQAQPKNSDDAETFERVKESLVKAGIAEEQIKIKTAQKDELKGIDLMSRDCEVRYIITVDALKEGWDCPFAYILASLANKTSRVSVEQILGRILRQPYTCQHGQAVLNLSYVFTCSNDFNETLTDIVTSLNKSGFSAKDYVVESGDMPGMNQADDQPSAAAAQDAPTVPANDESQPVLPLAAIIPHEPLPDAEEDTGTEDFDDVDLSDVAETLAADDDAHESNSFVDTFIDKAKRESERYNNIVRETAQNSSTTGLPLGKARLLKMKREFVQEAKDIRLPQFFRENGVKNAFINTDGMEEVLLEKADLLAEFSLEQCDTVINFEQTRVQAVKIELEERDVDEYVPKQSNLSDDELQKFMSYFKENLDGNDGKVRQLTNKVLEIIGYDYNGISRNSLYKYIKRVLSDEANMQKLDSLASSLQATADAFRRKIDELSRIHRQKTFFQLIEKGKIRLVGSYALPDSITIKGKMVGVKKGLYLDEETVNGFEKIVIDGIANLPNVRFWHRILERKEFYINGFVNHYPDFLVVLNSGKILLVEAKGDDRDNGDSKEKLALGKKWADLAGGQYRYFMVFDQKEVEGAYTLPDLLNTIKEIR